MFKKKPLDLDPRILKRLFRQENEVQVMVYWEDHYEVLVALLLMEEDEELVQKAIYLLSKSLNLREKYIWTAFIYHKLFVVKNRFQGHSSELINNIKFELGQGLHFSREYAEAKRLFDDLDRVLHFDHSLYEDWYEHTSASAQREQYLDTNAFLLPLGKVLLSLLYLVMMVTGFYPLYITVVFLLVALLLQFSYYWEKVSGLFGSFKKHKSEVKALKVWIGVEAFLTVLLSSLLIYLFSPTFKVALILVALVWLFALAFNWIHVKRVKKRIRNATSSEST